MIRIDGIDYYRQYDCQPLRVTLKVRRGVVWYDRLALDGLLAGAVVRRATRGHGLIDTPDAYDIPLPLKCLWRNEDGHPLWAASYFAPVGEALRTEVYQHKRAMTGLYSRGRGGRLKVATNTGRNMERRVPYPVLDGDLEAVCLGDPDAIRQLLEPIRFVGKRRNTGLGEVDSWTVEPVDSLSTADLLIHGGELSRAIPAAAASVLNLEISEPPVLVGWTPPQWKPSLFAPGWPAGTRMLLPNTVELARIDYYAQTP